MSENKERESRRPRGQYSRGRRGPNRRNHSRHGRSREEDEKIQRLIRNVQELLADTNQAICLEDLNAYERKKIHQFFDNKADFETKTYRNGEEYLLWVFPITKLRQFAEEKARQALESGEEIDLPPMSNYERFIVHDALKSWDSVETTSYGEGDERHVRITPVRFGRKLKRMVKKIKFF
ncbi:MAG: hypothetical protein D6814_12440 [Calditrichaeota bacterium]|nr:MAG: hypothetical protein D6814_12440 [Calditrichota bacterium]